jgi:hypothetical protein
MDHELVFLSSVLRTRCNRTLANPADPLSLEIPVGNLLRHRRGGTEPALPPPTTGPALIEKLPSAPGKLTFPHIKTATKAH